MKHRMSGYVVGRKELDQVAGWRIARKTREGRVNYFVPDAEIAEGIELYPSLDVTFTAETRDGRKYALNVEPKPAFKMEESMRKMKRGLIAALMLAIIAVMGIWKPHHQEPLRGWIVETRAVWALGSIRRLTADQIITDEVVREAIRDNRWGNLRGASWAARWQMFNEHQCHIFDIGGYEDVEKTCNIARYSEGNTTRNPWYENAGIPVSIAPTIAQMRTELYSIARSYLMTPTNVRAVYEAKQRVIIDEFRQLSDEDKQSFLGMLNEAIASFEQFRDDESARVKYANYIRLENAWRANESDSLEPFRAWQDAGATLRTAVTDESFYLFAGRRHAEGGDELISAYIEIMHDLASQLNG